MSSKMLIDASHPEETRVVVTSGNKIEDFDFESEHKKQIRGNIYLAKITRVEPSLQAAFVEYGGNRHGFLPFSEIHPDYYQIPVADREALLREYARELEEADDVEPAGDADEQDDAEGVEAKEPAAKPKRRSRRGGRSRSKSSEDGENGNDNAAEADEPGAAGESDGPDEQSDVIAAMIETDSISDDPEPSGGDDDAEPAPKPARRTTRRKAPVAKAASEPAADEPVAEGDKAGEEEAAKPKRRSTRRKKADVAATAEDAATPAEPSGDAAVSEEAAEAASGEAATEEKPKARRRTGRRKKAPEAEPSAETVEKLELNEAEGGSDDADDADAANVEEAGAEDAFEETAPLKQRAPRKHYKIQEVVKRRQIMLVQVTKEERGNKGAALTTYLSLAGRYSVLMPNTARGGGISRKIAQASDRKRLKEIARELDVPSGMGVILRTAAASRTKQEVNRDFDYLMRLWDSVRELTLSSSAPALVYEEGDLIKRSIRDLYRKEITDIVVAGEDGYREAKDFMKMLMPSQARVVKRWQKPTPLYAAHGVEAELDRMLQPNVTLKSGGYIIINQTEALVAIDVNSGRATREHSIEATALRTNLEAAEEVGRQLRLRDLAGLIVIDFIDMDEKRNNRAVEKRLKDCLKDDRARIQLGRISSFGLLEMSRQRMRSSVLESTMQVCETCHGNGYTRSPSSIALQILRGIEEQMRKSPRHNVLVRTDASTALHVLNQKRAHISALEEQYGTSVVLEADARIGNQNFQIERGAQVERAAIDAPQVRQDAALMDELDEDETATEEAVEAAPREASAETEEDREARGKRRRRGRRGGKNRRGDDQAAEARDADETEPEGSFTADTAPDTTDEDGDAEAEAERPRRARRSKRKAAPNADGDSDQEPQSDPVAVEARQTADSSDTPDEDAPKQRRSTRRRKAPLVGETAASSPDPEVADDTAAADSGDSGSDPAGDGVAVPDTAAPKRPGRRTRRAPLAEAQLADASAANGAGDVSDPESAPAPKRAGRRTKRAPIAEAVATIDAATGQTDSAAASQGDGATSVIDAIAAANGADEVPEAGAVTTEANAGDDADGSADDGKKKQWWNRGFF